MNNVKKATESISKAELMLKLAGNEQKAIKCQNDSPDVPLRRKEILGNLVKT